jgi:acyl-CoA reductase-like NAD-dependent aldehyde dehydrogenase
MGTYGRQKLLLKLADIWDKNSEELSELESLNNGTPIAQQKGVVTGLADEIRYHAGIIILFNIRLVYKSIRWKICFCRRKF